MPAFATHIDKSSLELPHNYHHTPELSAVSTKSRKVRKHSRGRQKIEISKIRDKNPLQVTFSKRRTGIFKKASELCHCLGVEIAIMVLSPAGKVFSFAHPNLKSLVNRFSTPSCLVGGELKLQPSQIMKNVELETERYETLDITRKANSAAGVGEILDITKDIREDCTLNITRKAKAERGEEQSQKRWEIPVAKLKLNELDELMSVMEELKKNVLLELCPCRKFDLNKPAMEECLCSKFGLNIPAMKDLEHNVLAELCLSNQFDFNKSAIVELKKNVLVELCPPSKFHCNE